MRSKTGGTAAGPRSRSPTPSPSRSRFVSPPPVMWARPWTATSERSRSSDRAHVDHGRLEQRVGHRGAAELRRARRRGPRPPSSEQRAAGERVAVGVQAAATAGRSARRPGRRRAPVTIASSATVPNAVPQRSKPCGDGWPRISSGRTASSPPGISTPACLGADASGPRRSAPARAGRPARRRGSRRSAIGSAPTQTTSLTFIATQSMPTVSRRSACSATTSLEPTPSVRQRDAEVRRDPQHARVVARRQAPSATAGRARSPQHADERADARVGLGGVDAGGGVGVAHRRRSCQTRRIDQRRERRAGRPRRAPASGRAPPGG